MPTMMIAKKDTRYNGMHLRAGDRFEVLTEKSVRLYTLTKRAEVVNTDIDGDPLPEAPRARRAYKRRDLRAED